MPDKAIRHRRRNPIKPVPPYVAYRTPNHGTRGELEAQINPAQRLAQQKRYAEAEQRYRSTLANHPNNAEAHYNFGIFLQEQRRLSEAEQHYRTALQLQPNLDHARNNLGVVLRITGQFQEAELLFRQALSGQNPHPLYAWNLSSLLLAQGRYAEGWQLNESRYQVDPAERKSIPLDVSFPRWQGESLSGKSLLIWPEQGFGDQIQFARYGKQLKQMGAARLTLVCDDPLLGLLLSAPGFDTVLPLQHSEQRLEPHDYWIQPFSLPLFCHESPESIPAEIPYLWAWAERHAHWIARLTDADTKLRIGLVWKGSIEHANDADRSLPGLSTLKPLWSVAGTRFISLQKREGEQEALDASTSDDQPLIALGTELRDFADTAAVIAALDLVICVDTSVAHVAGALGKPVWVLLPANGTDWRWQQERSDSPWYPGVMRLFRQRTSGGWNDAIEEVKQALQDFVQHPPGLPMEPIEPKTLRQHYALAEIAESHEDYGLAAHHYLQALEQTTPANLLRHELVVRALSALKRAGDLAGAITLAETEMPNWQHSPDFFFVLGDLMLDWAIQNPDKAMSEILPIVEASWLKCLEIGEQPNLRGAIPGRGSHLAAHNLAVFHESLGNSTQAQLFREKAERLRHS